MIEAFKFVAIFYDSNRKLKPFNLNKNKIYAVKYYFKKETALFIFYYKRIHIQSLDRIEKHKERKLKLHTIPPTRDIFLHFSSLFSHTYIFFSVKVWSCCIHSFKEFASYHKPPHPSCYLKYFKRLWVSFLAASYFSIL